MQLKFNQMKTTLVDLLIMFANFFLSSMNDGMGNQFNDGLC